MSVVSKNNPKNVMLWRTQNSVCLFDTSEKIRKHSVFLNQMTESNSASVA